MQPFTSVSGVAARSLKACGMSRELGSKYSGSPPRSFLVLDLREGTYTTSALTTHFKTARLIETNNAHCRTMRAAEKCITIEFVGLRRS